MSNTTTQTLDTSLTFLTLTRSPVEVNATGLILATQDSKLLQCTLTLHLSAELYEQIQTQTLFNLNPEIQNAQVNAPFQPEIPIALTISLRPDLLPQLADHPASVAAYLTQLNTEEPNHPLFSTDSWFVLQVNQTTSAGDIGYRTFWDYVSPSLMFQEDVSSDAIADGLVQFFQDWATRNLPEMTQEAMAEVLQDFSQEVDEQLSDSDLEALTQDAIATIFSELITGFDRWTKGEPAPAQSQARSLLQTVQTFFQQDGWDFRLINRENTVQLAFQGKHDRWTCYAQTHEEQHSVVFYSIFPAKVPTERRSEIAHFLTLANYGMIIGNFELDFKDGEIRYKTSLDVTGDRITPALIKSLVYTNVLTLDQYLPGIQAVLEGSEPAAAIAAIEQP